MSLADHYKRKVIADQSAAAELRADVFHAWCDVWLVRQSLGNLPPDMALIFNPKTNLHNASFDATTTHALVDIAKNNEVFATRIRLCVLTCALMINRPNWSIIRDVTMGHLKLCEGCAHNMAHHYEHFTSLSPEKQSELKASWEKLHPGCVVDEITGALYPPGFVCVRYQANEDGGL